MSNYYGFTHDEDVLNLIRKVKENMRAEALGNDQVRSKDETFLGFAGKGALNILENTEDEISILNILQTLKGVYI